MSFAIRFIHNGLKKMIASGFQAFAKHDHLVLSASSHPLAELYHIVTSVPHRLQEEACLQYIQYLPSSIAEEMKRNIAIHPEKIKKGIEVLAFGKFASLSEKEKRDLLSHYPLPKEDTSEYLNHLINALYHEGHLKGPAETTQVFRGFERLFEKRTHLYQIEGNTRAPLQFSYINGIGRSFQNAKQDGKILSKSLEGVALECVYVPDHGLFFDLISSVIGQAGILTPPEKYLLRIWRQFFEQAPKEGIFVQLCHSRGAIHVRNALKYLTKEEKNRLIIIALAPAQLISSLDVRQAYNVFIKGDPVKTFAGIEEIPILLENQKIEGKLWHPHHVDNPNFLTFIRSLIL